MKSSKLWSKERAPLSAPWLPQVSHKVIVRDAISISSHLIKNKHWVKWTPWAPTAVMIRTTRNTEARPTLRITDVKLPRWWEGKTIEIEVKTDLKISLIMTTNPSHIYQGRRSVRRELSQLFETVTWKYLTKTRSQSMDVQQRVSPDIASSDSQLKA